VPLNLMERVMFLRSTEVAAGLPDPALRTIAEVAHERSYHAGEVLCREHDLGTEMFLIVDGSVEVRMHDRPAAEAGGAGAPGTVLAVLGRGDTVGEMSVLDDQPRSATVAAREPVRVLAVHKEDLRDAIALCPDVAFGLFRVLSARLRKTSATTTLPAAGRPGALRQGSDA